MKDESHERPEAKERFEKLGYALVSKAEKR
jgi:hypothetical protein